MTASMPEGTLPYPLAVVAGIFPSHGLLNLILVHSGLEGEGSVFKRISCVIFLKCERAEKKIPDAKKFES